MLSTKIPRKNVGITYVETEQVNVRESIPGKYLGKRKLLDLRRTSEDVNENS